MRFEPNPNPDVPSSTSRLVRGLLDRGRLELPAPGRGDTAQRFFELSEIARTFPVGVGRLAEAHLDATAILVEAGRQPRPGSLYGVWASTSTPAPILVGDVLNGTKRFCSGLGVVDRALVVVTNGHEEQLLVDVDTHADDTISFDLSRWATVALADTATGDIEYTNHDIDADGIVASGEWYLNRPGFWHGACGPAACWAGATYGLIDVAEEMLLDDPHQQAHVGAMRATRWTITALLEQAGRQIDADVDGRDAAELRGRSLRHSVERLCSDVLDRFARAFGPRPLTADRDVAQRIADTHLYLRQHHGERELPAISGLPTRFGGRL